MINPSRKENVMPIEWGAMVAGAVVKKIIDGAISVGKSSFSKKGNREQFEKELKEVVLLSCRSFQASLKDTDFFNEQSAWVLEVLANLEPFQNMVITLLEQPGSRVDTSSASNLFQRILKTEKEAFDTAWQALVKQFEIETQGRALVKTYIDFKRDQKNAAYLENIDVTLGTTQEIERQQLEESKRQTEMLEALAEKDPAKLALKRYLEQLTKQCLTMRLDPLGEAEGTGEGIGLNQVYIDLDTTTHVPEASDGEDRKMERLGMHGEDSVPLTADQAFSKSADKTY
jgi:hypothetical protein